MRHSSYCLFCGKFLSKNKSKHICDACYEKIRRNKRKMIKYQAVNYKGGRCCVCGYNKSIQALTFHHINPKHKKFNISKFLKFKEFDFEDLKTELDKTILLCKNCHSEVNSGIITDKKIKKIIGKEKFNEMMNIS